MDIIVQYFIYRMYPPPPCSNLHIFLCADMRDQSHEMHISSLTERRWAFYIVGMQTTVKQKRTSLSLLPGDLLSPVWLLSPAPPPP